jgi:hypothetical protein
MMFTFTICTRESVVSQAKEHGVKSLPAVMIDGKLAGCCARRGPDERTLRDALR